MCSSCSVPPTPVQASALSRRRMLGVTAAVGTSAALTTLGTFGGTANAASAGSHPGSDRRRGRVPVENISIQLYTLREPMAQDLNGTLEKLAKLGYRRVEHAGVPAGLTAKQFRTLLNSLGLKATSGHNTPPTMPFDPVAWGKTLDTANVLGQTNVNISVVGVTGFDPATGLTFYQTAAEWREYCKMLNKAGKMAAQAGLKLGLHNHYWEFLPLKDSVLVGQDILIAETDPRYVHFEIDLYWATYAHHDPAQLVAFLQDRITQFHVKDLKLVPPTTAGGAATYTFTDPGAGVIDFARIFDLKTASPSRTEYIVERDDAGANALNTAKVGFDFLKNIRF